MSKTGGFGISNFTFCKVHTRKNVLQQIFHSDLFTNFFPLSNACLMLIPFQHWYSLDCYLVQVLLKYKFLLAKLSEHFPEKTQIKYLILTKSMFLSSTQTWKTGCLLLLRVPDNPSPPQCISFNFN